jgi:hypothetical protein
MERLRKGKIIKGGDRQTAINVYNYFKKQFPHKSDNCIIKELVIQPPQVERLSTE